MREMRKRKEDPSAVVHCESPLILASSDNISIEAANQPPRNKLVNCSAVIQRVLD